MGSPGLFDPVGEPVRFRVRKHLGLLIYLATEKSAVYRRDYLADLLWPSARSVNEGRHSLATALSVIRAHLGPRAILATRDTVRLASDALTVDVWHLQHGHPPTQSPASTAEPDGFLDPFELQDAEPFMRWRERMQARLLPAIAASIDEKIESARRSGNAREMERLADRLLTLDPLNEHGIRAKMEACAFAGDRVAALRVFERWKAQLVHELNAFPSDATERVASRLRLRGWERASEIGIAAASTDQWRDTAFVGREREYQLLYDAWTRSRTRRTQHVLIEGEPGIGKTTLAERLTTAAVLEGAAIARVKCYEVDRSTPYTAIGFLATHLLRLPGASATWPEALGELARIAPEVRSRFPSAPEPLPSQGESARVHLAEAFHQLASAIADENPLIVVLDDIHLADDASLAVLHLAMRRTLDQPIMFLFTVRQGEADQAPRATELCEAAVAFGFVRVELGPLKESEASELVDRLLGAAKQGLPPMARKAILAAGAGYPMALELLVQEWRDHGGHAFALSVPAMTQDLPLAAGTTHQSLLDRLTLNLDEVTQKVLNVAALLGRRLNDLEFYSLVELSTGETMMGLTRLKQMRVLRESGQGLEFAHEPLRARAYREVPSPVRKALHSRIADRLIAASANRQQGLEIAWHCMRAGRSDEAVMYLLDGAEHAAQSGAPHEAERALETAFPLLSGVQRQRAAILLAEVQQEQGRWVDSLSTLDQHGVILLDPWKSEAEVLRVLARLLVEPGAATSATSGLPFMHTLMRNHRELALAIRAASVAAHICAYTKDLGAARVTLALASSLAKIELDPYRVLHISTTCALAAYHAGEHSTSSEYLLAAKRVVEAHGIANSVAVRIYVGLGAFATGAGRYAEALLHLEAGLHLATRLGCDDTRRTILANAALCHGRLGNTTEQMRTASGALEGVRERSLTYDDIHAGAMKASAHASLGQRDEALEMISLVDQQFARITLPWLVTAWKLMKADTLLMLGSTSAAKACARDVVQLHRFTQVLPHFEGKIAAWTAAIAESPAELAEARECISTLLGKIQELDLMDQAEVLAAAMVVSAKASEESGELAERLHATLQELPVASAELLTQLRLTPQLRGQLAGQR